jgi:hypothetical protein
MDISFGVNSDFDSWDELGFVTSSESDIVIYVHWADTNNGYRFDGYHENIDSIENLQILAKYNVLEFMENNYQASYTPRGFLGDKGKTEFNHTESFEIWNNFIGEHNYTEIFTICIAIINYEVDQNIQVITMNSYDLRFGSIKNDKVYIRFWDDANANNM